MADDKNNTPEELELPDFEIEEGAFEFSLDEVVDAELVEVEEEKPKRMSKEEMIAAGLLPPTVDKKPLTKAVEQEISTLKEIPVEQMTRQQPKHANAVNTDNITQLASNRGSIGLDLVKVLVADGKMQADVKEVVAYAFALADAIQEEVDRDYQQRLVEEASKQLRTS